MLLSVVSAPVVSHGLVMTMGHTSVATGLPAVTTATSAEDGHATLLPLGTDHADVVNAHTAIVP